MRRVINNTIRLLRDEYIADLFDELIYKNKLLRSVKKGSDKLCEHLPSKHSYTTAMRVMNWRRKDAIKELIQKNEDSMKMWRESEKRLCDLRVLDSYFQIW